MRLPPYQLITFQNDWQVCLEKLRTAPQLALDLEANSMFAYRERVCLIQISIPGQDYIIDPETDVDLSDLGDLIADPGVEKVFHAAEYDLILLKQDFNWELSNLFDTMWAARILGYERYGLANILKELYGVRLNKRYQKSNWCRRPLKPEQLNYAQLDTHYLLRLRARLAAELEQSGRWEEAQETFAQQSRVAIPNTGFHPDDFWSINGVHDLNRRRQAVLRELNIFRDTEAKRRDQPLFKVFGDRTLLELAQNLPSNLEDLSAVHGMSSGQIRRYGRQLLRVVWQGMQSPYPTYPRRNNKLPEDVINRYDRLHTWRKERAQRRGVESDVILSRDALRAIAHHNPQTLDELAGIDAIGAWRCRTYGPEILRVLRET